MKKNSCKVVDILHELMDCSTEYSESLKKPCKDFTQEEWDVYLKKMQAVFDKHKEH